VKKKIKSEEKAHGTELSSQKGLSTRGSGKKIIAGPMHQKPLNNRGEVVRAMKRIAFKERRNSHSTVRSPEKSRRCVVRDVLTSSTEQARPPRTIKLRTEREHFTGEKKRFQISTAGGQWRNRWKTINNRGTVRQDYA